MHAHIYTRTLFFHPPLPLYLALSLSRPLSLPLSRTRARLHTAELKKRLAKEIKDGTDEPEDKNDKEHTTEDKNGKEDATEKSEKNAAPVPDHDVKGDSAMADTSEKSTKGGGEGSEGGDEEGGGEVDEEVKRAKTQEDHQDLEKEFFE